MRLNVAISKDKTRTRKKKQKWNLIELYRLSHFFLIQLE